MFVVLYKIHMFLAECARAMQLDDLSSEYADSITDGIRTQKGSNPSLDKK